MAKLEKFDVVMLKRVDGGPVPYSKIFLWNFELSIF